MTPIRYQRDAVFEGNLFDVVVVRRSTGKAGFLRPMPKTECPILLQPDAALFFDRTA
jgi:hypothetical protein